jgi:hypothetical protein
MKISSDNNFLNPSGEPSQNASAINRDLKNATSNFFEFLRFISDQQGPPPTAECDKFMSSIQDLYTQALKGANLDPLSSLLAKKTQEAAKQLLKILEKTP